MNIKRNICIFLVLVIVIEFSCGCGESQSTGPTTSTSTTTSGGTINPATPGLEGCGVNLQPSYYCDGDMNLGWNLMDNYPDIKTLRIELDTSTNSTMDDFVRWISEANSNGYDVIATYHYASELGSNNPNQLLAAANWWVDNWDTLSSAGSFKVNLMNEWGNHSVSSEDYAEVYNAAIDTVRKVYHGPIICDIPGWGQETHTAADASTSIVDDDIIFSVHIYPVAWNSRTGDYMVNSDLDYLENSGRPCMIGEFGSKTNSPNANADWSALVDHARGKGWSVIGWCWNGDGGGMNMISPYWGSSCDASSYTKSAYFDTIYSKLGSFDTTNQGGN
jgi:mannan endo-1,4-beta-mannosidase